MKRACPRPMSAILRMRYSLGALPIPNVNNRVLPKPLVNILINVFSLPTSPSVRKTTIFNLSRSSSRSRTWTSAGCISVPPSAVRLSIKPSAEKILSDVASRSTRLKAENPFAHLPMVKLSSGRSIFRHFFRPDFAWPMESPFMDPLVSIRNTTSRGGAKN